MRFVQAESLLLNLLKQRLTEAKSRNSQVSIRSFARTLGVPAGTLSLVLLGKRSISTRLATKLVTALKLSENESKIILNGLTKTKKPSTHSIIAHERNRKIETLFKPNTIRLSEQQFDLLKEWYYFGILSLVQTKTFKTDPVWIGKRLNILPSTAENALKKLIELRMIIVDENGTTRRNYDLVRTSDGTPNASIRRAHEQNLELARKAMIQRKFDECDFSSINLPVNIDDLPKMKELIRKFEREFLDQFAKKAGADEVLRVCVQAFTITHPEKDAG